LSKKTKTLSSQKYLLKPKGKECKIKNVNDGKIVLIDNESGVTAALTFKNIKEIHRARQSDLRHDCS